MAKLIKKSSQKITGKAAKAVKAAKPAKPTKAAKTAKTAKKVTKPAKAISPAAKKPAKVEKPTNGHKQGKSNGKPANRMRSEILGVEPVEDPNLSPFLRKQRGRLLVLRDSMLDSMMETAKDNLRSRAEGSEASAFGMHQADAGSDAYDRDFALNLLSQEQDALYEIDQAIKRIDTGSYGVCEMSGKAIPHPRLEAIPFARLTVECQSQIERQNKLTRSRHAVTSLFGLTDEESGDGEEADTSDSKD